MPRFLRYYVLGCVAIAFAYLALHVTEPLRLNVGDPWGDANVISLVRSGGEAQFPPLPEALSRTIGKLGVEDIAVFRVLALALSMLSLWLMYQWARRVWSEPVAAIATALCATSLMWMLFADSIRQIPIVHASAFLALWGVVRSIESRQRRHYAAAAVGMCACFLAGYELWIFLPAAILFTLHAKRGTVLGQGSLRFVVMCAAAIAFALFVKGLVSADPIGWQVYVDRKLSGALSTVARRYTVLLSPLLWITLAVTLWRGLRAPSWRSVVDDGTTWLLVVALASMFVMSRRATSPMLAAEPLLPLFAIGSALLISQLLDGRRTGRALGIAWLAIAPAWSFFVLLQSPHSVLAREDVAKVNAYLAANDRNDFVITNLLAGGPIQAAFDRRSWPARDSADLVDAYRAMLDVFEAAGTEYVHAVIFTTPESRFIDRSLGQLTLNRQLGAVVGWPSFVRARADGVIRDYDKRVLANLEAVHAKVVLHFSNFDVYRIERAQVIEAAGGNIPVLRRIDFGNFASIKHMLLGWGEPWLTPDGVAVTTLDGFAPCANPVSDHHPGEPASNACETVMTARGLKTIDDATADRAQLLIRVERSCDLKVTIDFGAPALVAVSFNGFTTSQCEPGMEMSFVVPQASVHAGINVVGFEKLYRPKDNRADIASLALQCAP